MTPASADPAPTPAPAPAKRAEPPVLTGSGAILASLEKLGVTDVFGIPGGAIMPFYDELMASTSIRHILVRHEQGAGHAAEGYAAASGRVGVAIATSGPGATNLVTAIADAHMDSVPIIAITGQVFSTSMGTDAFQEVDIVGITMPITKHSFLVTRPEDVPATLAAAYQIATTGRPGPVLVDVTKDAQQKSAPFVWPPKVELPGYRPVTKAHGKQIVAAAELLAGSQRPVLYVGGGVIRSGAEKELLKLAELTGAPVVTTLMARGAFPDSHRQHLGMPGMHGSVPAVLGLQEADLIVALGARFDDRVTGRVADFAPEAKIVHVDIDPAEIGKIRTADVPIVGDAKDVIVDLIGAYGTAAKKAAPDLTERESATALAGSRVGAAVAAAPWLAPWWARLDKLRKDYPLGYTDDPDDGLLAPQTVIERIGQLSGPEAVYVAGVGQHQMWAAQFIDYERPHAWLNSGGAGTMGYAVPAAMGAKVAQPDRLVWAIDGDGCFQMTNQELATCTINDIPIKVAIINNSSLGMVRQWQTLFYDGRHSFTDLDTGAVTKDETTRMVPDFVKLAEAYGALGIRVTKPEEIDPAIKLAIETNDRPVVIDFVVSRDAMVWPMVPQGVGNSQVQYARDHAPAWEEE
ncbi:MAG: acetolactate synthase large subunit [Microbacteriaceae bacterium]|nr:acetolactate synthase large subunit [Microbacteriaceae bacterium]